MIGREIPLKKINMALFSKPCFSNESGMNPASYAKLSSCWCYGSSLSPGRESVFNPHVYGNPKSAD